MILKGVKDWFGVSLGFFGSVLFFKENKKRLT